MKLGAAKIRLKQISLLLVGYKDALTVGPRAGIVATLDECTALLRERQSLLNRISETEAVTELQETSLTELNSVFALLESKIELLGTLTKRQDLDNSTKEALFEQLKNHMINRDNLETSINECLWETALLVE